MLKVIYNEVHRTHYFIVEAGIYQEAVITCIYKLKWYVYFILEFILCTSNLIVYLTFFAFLFLKR